MREKFERFPKIIARTGEEKKEAKEKLKERYLEECKKMAPYEIPKTENELYIIKDMESASKKFVKKHGGIPKSLPDGRIHFLKLGGVEAYTKGGHKGATFGFVDQYIAIDRTPSDTETALLFVHENLHLNSPAAVKISEGKIRSLWAGIEVYGGKKVYFEGIGEAIISELTNQVYQKEIKKNPFYRKEVEANERILPWIKKISQWRGWDKEKEKIILSGFYAIPEMLEILKEVEQSPWPKEKKLAYLEAAINGFTSKGRGLGIEWLQERIELAKLLDEIFKKSKEAGARFKFRNRQEIFNEFAKSVFTANPLRARRIIEGVLGKDSFRSIAER